MFFLFCFFVRGVPGGGQNLIFSSLEIRPSNINTIFSYKSKKFKKNIFAKGVPGGRGNVYIFCIIRDRTFKHKYQHFLIIQRYQKRSLYIFIHPQRQTALPTCQSSCQIRFFIATEFRRAKIAPGEQHEATISTKLNNHSTQQSCDIFSPLFANSYLY